MDHLKTWLEHEQTPNSFYQLLGVPCLSDERDKLVSLTKSATRFLHQYQNHGDKQIVERARRLQLLCARAAYTFSNDEEWTSYDRSVLDRIREERRAIYPDESFHRRLPDIRIWLRDVQQIASHRIDEVLNLVRPIEAAASIDPPTPVKPNLESNPTSTSVSSSLVFATLHRPVPPPIPQQASPLKTTSPPNPSARAEPPHRTPGTNNPDRRIWQLTALFLTLAFVGALWLWSKGWGRHWY